MINRDYLAQFGELGLPATDEQIAQVEAAVGYVFPSEYRDSLQMANGIVFTGIESLILYATDEIEERNLTYEVKDYLTGWLLIGDDGGGRGILLDCEETPGAVYLVGLGALFREDARCLAATFDEWVSHGFKLDD
ncbi:MAG: SMI1/KNR4 family protein [Caldilinea sp. CFX5]|nr:SMI1/KNR4 family protein [Caldilinea sp. CFX5]